MDTIQMKIAKTAAQNWGQQEPTTLEEALGITWDSEVAAVNGMTKALKLDKSVVEKLVGTRDEAGKLKRDGEIYTKDAISPEIAEQIRGSLRGEDSILSILSTIHDSWVKNNPNNFLKEGRNKERQFVDLKLLNWGEVESDLLFLQPILEAAGVTVDIEALKEAHEMQQMEYMIDNKIFSHEDLVAHISQGSKTYSALEGLETRNGGNIDQLLQNPEIAERMAGQIESKVAIRSREDLAKHINESENTRLEGKTYTLDEDHNLTQITLRQKMVAEAEGNPFVHTNKFGMDLTFEEMYSRGIPNRGYEAIEKLNRIHKEAEEELKRINGIKEEKSVVQEEKSRRGTISLKGIMQAIMGKFRVGKNDLESARGTINELAKGQKGDETKEVSTKGKEGVGEIGG